jgi:predicted enzyme related to lactoylglutathione lyase
MRNGEVSASSAPPVILYASKLEEAQQRVEKAGGKIVKPIFSFPGGRRFHFNDPAGNELAIWSDK